jgi:hypothetical protein
LGKVEQLAAAHMVEAAQAMVLVEVLQEVGEDDQR